MSAFAAIEANADFQRVLSALKSTKPAARELTIEGLWGSAATVATGLLAAAHASAYLLVVAHNDAADDARDDIELAAGRAPQLFPQQEGTGGDTDLDEELEAERMRLALELWERKTQSRAIGNSEPPFVVASIHAIMQPVASPAALAQRARSITVGERIDPETLVTWLTESGYELADQVESPGDAARRGGIVDVFTSVYRDPIRIDFIGDEIESLRFFDAGTQRSANPVDSVRIPTWRISPDAIQAQRAETVSFLSLFPDDAVVVFVEPTEIQELGRTFWQRLGERAGIVPADAVFRAARHYRQVHFHRFAVGDDGAIRVDVGSLPQFEPKAADSINALRELTTAHDVTVFCDTAPEQERFRDLLRETPLADGQPGTIPARLRIAVGMLHTGFRWGSNIFVAHHELFHRMRPRRTLRRVAPSRPIDSFFDLSAGDYVVHALHGIGQFKGLQTLDRGGVRDEYMVVEFADEAVVHVPVSQVHIVQKYIGSFRGKPKLSKIGSSAWKRTKERVAEAVTDLAAELLAVQARRAVQPGIAYPADTNWQREFEGSFPYQETDDQLRAIHEIKGDMTRPRPMDRLLCGDVGFGKTELAMRAAFKAIEYGKQVAVLVPTTVLAEQHYQTFRERLADYPFSVDVLSRFRGAGEQRKIVEAARKGQVDVLIGTHRLLSSDVHFSDLGLVVIDEEQRFGVEAKEKLKHYRATVDVLTLSATPIPRTLHMSMLGMRDISSLATPPVDRRAVVTQVRMWDDKVIQEALLRELNREGQIYFVHNFVRDIEQIANRVRTLVPDARVVIGHGQMSGPELEEVMLKFMRREADVLVSTNIIESGIDIPSANTIFINRAERFGLADLHQLRGRVGRGKHRAYCYLLLSPKNPVQEKAARRLKAIEHFSQLGAGFQIAMRDLEIRGAGNILGPEQSGNIEAVGYEMYCQLLEQAVRTLKKEPDDPWRPVNLDLGITAAIPRTYIRSEKQRMEVYKRLAGCRTVEEVQVLESDLRDAFGDFPEEVATLLALAEIRAASQRWGVRSIILKPPDVIFSVDDLKRAEGLFAEGPGSPRLPDSHTVHWRLPARLLEPTRLVETLREQLRNAAAGGARNSGSQNAERAAAGIR